MITFKAEGEKMHVTLDSGLPIQKKYYPFSWNCENEAFAYMLAEQFKKHLQDNIARIREEEYLRGYKDGRGKKVKEQWFKRWF